MIAVVPIAKENLIDMVLLIKVILIKKEAILLTDVILKKLPVKV